MTTSLLSAVAAPQSGRPTALLLDHHEYAQAVLLRNRPVPWDEPVAYARFFGQAQGLLNPDLAILDLSHFYSHHLRQDPALQSAMAEKTRTGFALRTMLADKTLGERAFDLVQTLTSMVSGPVVLQIPSPMQWLQATHSYARSSGIADLDADDAENTSMYVADWLRSFAALPLAAVLLDNRTASAVSPTAVGFDAYTPITNVTAHYRLVVGMLDTHGIELHREAVRGSNLPEQYWMGAENTWPTADFYVSRVPATAVPETVLDQLGQLS